MRIVPYEGEDDPEEIESTGIVIRAVPFEDGFVPMFLLLAPDDDYFISLEEVNTLMDGVEIARERLDFLISEMIAAKIGKNRGIHPSRFYDAELDGGFMEEGDVDDNGESD